MTAKAMTDADVKALAAYLAKQPGITKEQAMNQAKEMQAEQGDVVVDTKRSKKV